MKYLIGGFLLVLAVMDIRKQKFSVEILFIMFASIVVPQLIKGEISWLGCLLGAVPGIVLIAFHYLTNGEVGLGDGVLFVILGFYFSLWENMALLFLSLTLELMVVAVLWIFRWRSRGGISRKMRIPFVPYVAGSFILLNLL